MTQQQKILQALKSKKGITSMGAFMSGVTQLGARLGELEAKGVVINREWVKRPNGKDYKRYWVEG